MKYEVKAVPDAKRQTIEVTTAVLNDSPEVGSMIQRLENQILNLKDRVIRESLVKLGWTPPSKEGAAMSKPTCAKKDADVDTQEVERIKKFIDARYNAKPCPFCGSTNIEAREIILGEGSATLYSRCADCRAQGPIVTLRLLTDPQQNAEGNFFDATKWNQRVP